MCDREVVEMETMKRIKRPKSCPSVRWRGLDPPFISSSLFTTSSSNISKTKPIMVGNEVKISSHGSESCSSRSCNYHSCNLLRHNRQSCRNNNLMFHYYLLLLLMASFTSFITLVSSASSSSSSSSSINHVVHNSVKSNQELNRLLNQNHQVTRVDENGQEVIDVFAIRGQNFTIRCSDDSDEVEGDDSNIMIAKQSSDIDNHWTRKSGKSLSSSNQYQVTPRGNLFIRSVGTEDEDTYTCSKSGKRSQLSVYWPPKLRDNKVARDVPQILNRPTAQTIRLECDVDGKPKATIKWFKDGMEIGLSGRITIRKSNLVISQSVTSDSGSYVCEASNVLANVSFNIANLTVQASEDRPQKPKGLQVGTVTTTSVSLSWKVAPVTNEDLPVLSYTVHYTPESGASNPAGLKEDQTLAMTNSIVVDRLTPGTNYSFYVRAYNKKGASEPSKIVRAQTKSLDGQVDVTPVTTSSEPSVGVSPLSVPVTSPVWQPVSITGFKPESPTSVLVSWQKLPSAITSPTTDVRLGTKFKITSFEVHHRQHSQPQSSNYQYVAIEDADASSAVVEGLQPGVKYDMRVVATLSSITSSAPTGSATSSIPNQRPPVESSTNQLGHWIVFEMPSTDSSATIILPPDSKGNKSHHFNDTSGIHGMDSPNNRSIIFTHQSFNHSTTTHVPDSPFNNFFNRTTSNRDNKSSSGSDHDNNHSQYLDHEEDDLILGMVLDKLIVWSTIALVIFISIITACIAIFCCRKG